MDTLFDPPLHYMQHFLSFVRGTPQERYENLLTQQPNILQRVPQHYIESYLGISRAQLEPDQKLAHSRNKVAHRIWLVLPIT